MVSRSRQASRPALIAKWEPRLGVQVARFYVQRMRTRWGSCNPITASIRLNTDLAKKPQECLEYIVVHEMVHLLEPTHNDRFVALMDRYLPNWQHQHQMLNRLQSATRIRECESSTWANSTPLLRLVRREVVI